MANCSKACNIDLAMKYLAEIEEFTQEVEECGHNLKIEKTQRIQLAEAEVRNNSELKMLRHEIDTRDFEIKRLNNAFGLVKGLGLKKLVQYEPRTIPPHSKANITHKVRILVEHISQDLQTFKLTGKYDNIDERIQEIRKFFNAMLNQLNECNHKNLEVKKTLQAMRSLDVRGSFIFQIYHSLLKFKGAESALQKMKNPDDHDTMPTRRDVPRIQIDAYDYQKFTS